MFCSRIGLVSTFGPILLVALVVTLVEGCSGPAPAVARTAVPSATTTTVPPTPAPKVTNLPDPSTTSMSKPTQTFFPSPETEYPLALGDTWVYQGTRYEAIPITEFITTTLVITETVVDVQRTSAYFAAKIHKDESAETPVFVAESRAGEPLRPAASSEYWFVVMGNQIFRQEGTSVNRTWVRRTADSFCFH